MFYCNNRGILLIFKVLNYLKCYVIRNFISYFKEIIPAPATYIFTDCHLSFFLYFFKNFIELTEASLLSDLFRIAILALQKENNIIF